MEAGLDRRAAGSASPQSRGEPAAGPLELDLARLEDVADERARSGLELELGRASG